MRVAALAALAAALLPVGAPAQRQGVRLNRVIELFERGAPPLGVFVSNVSLRGAASIAGSPLDFVIIDMEHNPFDPAALEVYLLGLINKRRILEKGNLQMDVVPIVRLPGSGRERFDFMIKQALDLGAFGVVVPHVNTAEDALAAVRAMRYPQPEGVPDFEPNGRRGVGYGRAAAYWGLSGQQYGASADVWPLDGAGELLLWVMIESGEAVENAREILKVPGVSGGFVGPSDLAFSLGVGFNDPQVETAIARVAAACRETGVPCGTLTGESGVAKRLQQGFRFLAVGSDGGISGSVERALRIGRGKQ